LDTEGHAHHDLLGGHLEEELLAAGFIVGEIVCVIAPEMEENNVNCLAEF